MTAHPIGSHTLCIYNRRNTLGFVYLHNDPYSYTITPPQSELGKAREDWNEETQNVGQASFM